jgi:hypothetical protein
MPATSAKQKRFMDAAAHNPDFAKQAGIPVSVAKDFSEASKGAKFGGPRTRPDLQRVNESKTRQGKTELFNKGGDTMASKMNPGFMAMIAKKKGMQEGSKADMASDKKQMMGMAKGGMHKMPDGKMMKDSDMKKGGMPAALAKHAAKPASKAHAGLKAGGAVNGVATKGKTKGTMIKMKSGGRSC